MNAPLIICDSVLNGMRQSRGLNGQMKFCYGITFTTMPVVHVQFNKPWSGPSPGQTGRTEHEYNFQRYP